MSIYWFAALVLAMTVAGTWLFLRGLEREEARRRTRRARQASGLLTVRLSVNTAAFTAALRQATRAMAEIQDPMRRAADVFRNAYVGVCPRCHETKFIGHGPLCAECFTSPKDNRTELRPCGCAIDSYHRDDCPWHPARRGIASKVRWFVREWMIGWHQGRRERAERQIRRHFDAETRWRYRA